MDDQNKNLILATALSFLVILVWFVLFPPPEPEPLPEQATATTTAPVEGGTASVPQAAGTPAGTTTPQAETREDALAAAPRVEIETPRLTGSISLLGGRIDDLSLKDYRVENTADAPIVTMLSPVDGPNAYYALYGWAAGAGLTADLVPGPNTVWSLASGQSLTPDTPVTLRWDNGAGLTFTRTISVDDDYMFVVTQSVENTSAGTVSLAPYGIIARHGEPQDLKNFFILHEGAVAMADGELIETDYDDIDPVGDHDARGVSLNGWTGFTDHYWMTTLIPEPGTAFEFSTIRDTVRDIYQTTTKLPTVTLAASESIAFSTQLFAGAKNGMQYAAISRKALRASSTASTGAGSFS